jgi:hypothetical protein
VKDTVDEKAVVLGLRGGGDCLWEEGLGGGVEEEEVVPWDLAIDEEGWPNRACHLGEVILVVLKACLTEVVDEVLHGRG